ncbi:uncharacterized protein LOC107475738 [Arachis duranensis]|uniref:Uncharacterized protein LOC107475738 n=1 Tax=Arachis duranensis TaxID=130453 RepID=A0A9C6TNJ0_ARADU|nr:uncharacterized protein LOC107475738 [Arachis duranensis]
MATRGQGRGLRENEELASSRNQADFLAVMTNLVNTMQASAATTNLAMERMNGNDNGSGGNSVEGGPKTLATFLEVNPPVFRGSTNPMEADDCFITIERALQVQHVPEGQLVELAAYQLAGEAQQWWQGTYLLLQQGKGNNVITWEVFREEFYNEYFPNSVRQAKELELLQLRQGSMTVAAYTSKFEELCRFSRVCQGPLGDPKGYEEWKCMKYQDGLRNDIMRVVAPLEVKSFVELVNKSRVVEDCSRKNATTSTDRGGYHDRGGGARSFAPRGRNFKRGEYVQQSQRDRATFQGNNNNHQRRYGCGGAGHMSWNYLEKANRNAGRPQQGRVYAITTDDAAKSDILIRDAVALIHLFRVRFEPSGVDAMICLQVVTRHLNSLDLPNEMKLIA